MWIAVETMKIKYLLWSGSFFLMKNLNKTQLHVMLLFCGYHFVILLMKYGEILVQSNELRIINESQKFLMIAVIL